MSTTEDIISIRRKLIEAVQAGAIPVEQQPFYQTKLLGILQECERKRQQCEAGTARLMEQYHREMGQRDGYTAMAGMIVALIDADIVRALREVEERSELALERRARMAADASTVTDDSAALPLPPAPVSPPVVAPTEPPVEAEPPVNPRRRRKS